MASPYILGNEEDQFGPVGYDESDYLPIQIPPELIDPGYVRTGGGRPTYFWQDQRPPPEVPSFSNLPPDYVRGPDEDPMAGPLQFWEDPYEYAARGLTPEEAGRAEQMSPYGLQLTPRGTLEPNIAFDPSKALVPLHKLALTPEEVEAGMEWMASPFLSPEDRRALEEAGPTPTPFAKATSGLMQAGYGTAESLTSPINIALLAGTAGLGGIPAASRIASGAFAAQMGAEVPELAQELGRAYESGDPEAIARAAGNLAATGVFTAGAGAHAIGPRAITAPEIRAERTAAEPGEFYLREPSGPLTERLPNAIQEPSPTEEVRGLPTQPGINERNLPAEEGAPGIPQRNLPPGDQGGAAGAEEARPGEIHLTDLETLTKEPVPKDPVERSNFETEFLDRGSAHNEEQGLPGQTRSVTLDEPWIATVDEAGNVVVNRPNFSRWLERVKPGDRLKAVQSIFSEEGIHGIARKTIQDAEIGDLWRSLTEPERALIRTSYGSLDPTALEQGVSPDVLYGHEYLRRQMQRLLREPVREKAEAKGYQWLKETAIDAIERVVTAVRRIVGSKASKTLDAMLGRMQDHIDAARKAKGMQPVDWQAAAAAAPRAMQKESQYEKDLKHLKSIGTKAAQPLAESDLASMGNTKLYDIFDQNNQRLESLKGQLSPTLDALLRVNIGRAYAEIRRRGIGPEEPEGERYLAGQLDTQPKTKFDIEAYRKSAAEVAARDKAKRMAEEAKPEVATLATSKYNNKQGDPLGTTYHATPEDWAAWQKQQADLTRFVQGRGDLSSPEGQALFKENERIKNKYGGMPPQPPKTGIEGAPRAMSREEQDRYSMVNRAREFFSGLPTRLEAAPNRFIGREAPMTYTKSPRSANRLVEYASAKVAAPEVARSMASEVLGDKWKDADFGKKLGAVLVEDRLRGMRDDMRRARDPDWQNVTSIVGHPNSPFQTEADFRRALADPEIQAAVQRHKDTVQQLAQAQHQLARGDLAGMGKHTDAFVNLEAVLPDVEERFGGGGRGNLMNPLRKKSRFSKKAKGTAEEYHLDYRRIAERMIEANFEEAGKRRMYGQLINDGLAVMTKPGEPIPHGFNAHSQPFTIERKGTPAGGGKAQTMIRYLWVNKDIYPEVRQALNVDGKVGEAALVNALNGINQIQLSGPTDAVWHIANMFGSIVGSQGGRTLLTDVVRKVPGLNLMDAIGRTTASAIKVLRDAPDVQKQIAELAKIGAMRPQHGRGIVPLGEKNALVRLLHPGNLIQLLDRAGRLVRDDLYKNLVDRGLVDDTVANRRLWVNQMGMYNGRLMGRIMRSLKENGVSPFVVAGTNFNRMALRRMTLSQGLAARNPAAAAQMKAVDLFGTLATLVVVPSVLNYLITGNPSGRPGTKYGQIDTGKDTKDGRHIVIDPAQWTGQRRGLRITGIQALIEGMREGQRGKRIGEQAAKDILGGAIHPWAGPGVQTLAVGTTGHSTSFYQESENPKDIGANVVAALKQLNPVGKAIVEGIQEHRGPAAQVGLSLGGAAGVKAIRPLTAYDKLRNTHEKWLANNPDRRIRESFERNEASTFPLSQYRDLDKSIRSGDLETAAQALQKVREVARDEDIFKRMVPTIGTGNDENPKPLFHESEDAEVKFLKSLSKEQRDVYKEAIRDRMKNFKSFLQIWRKRGPRPEALEQKEPLVVPTAK